MPEEKQKKDKLQNVAIAGGAAETVSRYGAAAKEHFVAYSGMDREAGEKLKKGLKSISEQKINPEYAQQNIRQQAGFSAEVKETARTNAENIINRDSTRKVRTDDIGRVNDQLYDHVLLDGEGNLIADSGTQMKFVGSSPKAALNKLLEKKYSKYLENNAKIEVPSDYYDGMLQEADQKIAGWKRQLDKAREQGAADRVSSLEEKINQCEKLKGNLQKSTLSRDEAIFARTHPALSTAADVTKVSHRAGVQSAGYGAAIGGSVSLVQNVTAMIKGEETLEEALSSVATDAAKSAAVGYGTGFAGSAIKGAMQNSKAGAVRRMATNTNLPAAMVAVAVTTAKTLGRYFQGEIDGKDCLIELGEAGTGMVASAVGAAIGQVLIPIPVVGGMVGSLVGYALSAVSYQYLVSALQDAKLARARREAIERECAQHIQMIRQYRAELEETISQYLVENTHIFHEAFDAVKQAMAIGDIDGFIAGTATIREALGQEAPFHNMQEFDALMSDASPIKL